jgi:formylglycine-generating enzyme required for sulfatase activity
MAFSGSRFFEMQNPRRSIIAAAALLFGCQAVCAADKYPEYLPTQYQHYFTRFEDERTLPEQMLNSVGMTSQEYGRGFALIAGISSYPRVSGPGRDLAAAREDVRKLANYFATYEKFDEIVVLQDDAVTEANLSFFLERYFPRRLRQFPHSRFLFAYSGHGITVDRKGYILTAEAHDFNDSFNSIPMTTLRAMFQQIVDSGFHVLALINACYSGEFLRRSFGVEKHFIPKYPGAHAITAGGTNELAWHDGAVGSGSVFFEKFFAALDGRVGKDGIVTVDDLAAYLKREVQISTNQNQNPLGSDLSRDGSRGGFFFFDRSPFVERGVLPNWDIVKELPFGAEVPCGGAVVTISLPSRAARPLSGAEECALKQKDVFRECESCPEMVVVPSGSLQMGSPVRETDRAKAEDPRHRVNFAGRFAVGKFSVTFDEWDACVSEGGCDNYRPADAGWGRGRRPVINVSWNDASAYVAWLSRKTGEPYHLLSEAEREYVTRAGTAWPFWWGPWISPQQANYDGNYAYAGGTKGEFRQRTMLVDSLQPNPWGLYHIHGNVWEWTQDCWHDSYTGAPSNGGAWTTGDCNERVLRGGSWSSRPKYLRASQRFGLTASLRDDNLGFRIGRTLTP